MAPTSTVIGPNNNEVPSSLEVNRKGRRPRRGEVGTFEGWVTAFGFSTASVFTSPNQDWVPDFAIAHSEITTYTDGRWGTHEYSLWPQSFDREHFHVACIPKQGSRMAPSDPIVWRGWGLDDWTTKYSGIPRMGQLTPDLMEELSKAAEETIESVNRRRLERGNVRRIRDFLTICLRHCVDRLRLLPAERGVIISLAAHVQRLILELAGLRVYVDTVQPRLDSQRDHRRDVLEVLGAHTHDPSVAQTLHRAGVPLWFQQLFSRNIVIWQVRERTPLPLHFSSTPCYPRLVLAVRDLSGALNTPGEWQRAMAAVVRRQLCASRLPQLLRDDEGSEAQPAAKRARMETQWPNQWSSSLGHARPVYVVENSKQSRTLAHNLPQAGPARTVSKRGKARVPSTAPPPPLGKPSFVMNPFRHHYESSIVRHSPAWTRALTRVSPLPQPSKSVTYFFPPPWLLDTLVEYEQPRDRQVRYLHHLVAIRTFCRVRLFDRTIAGRPLTISEWRDTLWGDYTLDQPNDKPETADVAGDKNGPSRAKVKHRLQQALRELFGRSYALASYDPSGMPELGNVKVTAEIAATDVAIQRRLVWEAYETNWRCELLAIDALMVDSAQWPEMERWTREAHASEVWGPTRSGMDLCPDPDSGLSPYCWRAGSEEGWESCRIHLQSFVHLLTRWPACPTTLRELKTDVRECDAVEYTRVQMIALDFYVHSFVERFHRLPTPPVLYPVANGAGPPVVGGASVIADKTQSSLKTEPAAAAQAEEDCNVM